MPIKLGMMKINADVCVAMPAESGEEELKAELKIRVRNSLVASKDVHDKIESMVGKKEKVRCLENSTGDLSRNLYWRMKLFRKM